MGAVHNNTPFPPVPGPQHQQHISLPPLPLTAAPRRQFPPTPYPAGPSVRHLIIQSDDLSGFGALIVDSLSAAPLYTFGNNPKRSSLSLNPSEPHILIHSCVANVLVGSIRFHSVLTENSESSSLQSPAFTASPVFTIRSLTHLPISIVKPYLLDPSLTLKFLC